jgi:hypothetical protein
LRWGGYYDTEYPVKPWDITIIPESGLTPVLDFIDVYLSGLKEISDPREKAFQKFWRSIVLKPMEDTEYIRIRSLVFQNLLHQNTFRVNQIKSLNISKNGILQITNIDDTKAQFDLISLWNTMRLPTEKLDGVTKKIREEEEALKESLNTEAYFGGSMIVTYAPTIALWSGALSLGYSVLQKSRPLIKQIKKITITMENGKTQPIDFSDNQTSVQNNPDNVLRLLAWKWIFFDTLNKVWYEPSWRAFTETRGIMHSMKRVDYIRQTGTNISEGDFQKIKSQLLQEIDGVHSEYMKSLDAKGSIWFQSRLRALSSRILSFWALQHAFFGAIFFSKFAKYQDAMNLAAWVSETMLFMNADKAWRALSSPLARFGIVGKIGNQMIGMVAWWLAVHYGHEAWEKLLDGKRTYWKYASRKWLWVYTDGASKIWNFVAGGWVTGQLDASNARLRDNWLANKAFDIGTGRLENVPIKWLWINHRFPEMTWFQHNINISTAPWDWLRDHPWRTIDDWNSQLETYKTKLASAIGKTMAYYQNQEWPFSYPDLIKEKGGKDKLLEWYLTEILLSWNMSDAFGGARKDIIDAVLIEAKGGWKKSSEKNISFYIRQQISFMYIDNDFINKRKFELDVRRQEIDGALWILSKHTTPEQMNYLKTIVKRMVENREIVNLDWGRWEKTNVLGMSSNKFTPSQEVQWFDGLLSDNRIIDWLPWDNMKVWAYFALLLDKMLEYKREYEFINEISKWNIKWVKWAL